MDVRAVGDVSDPDKLNGYLEMWKQTVTVQQHFNEIEWKIRGLALTALTFTLGAASFTASTTDSPRAIDLLGGRASSSAVMILIGLLIWLAFFFVDAGWYHKLLKASVEHGELLEKEIQAYLPGAGLTARISDRSPSRVWLTKWQLHSSGKLKMFYCTIATMLAVLASVLQLGGS